MPAVLAAVLVATLAAVTPAAGASAAGTAAAARVSPAPAAPVLPARPVLPAQTTVPVANPGFEGTYKAETECPNITGDTAPGWGDNTCWDAAAPVIRYERDTTAPRNGAAAQKVTLVSGSRVQFAQFFDQPFQEGPIYTVSAWMRSAAPMDVVMSIRQTGPPYEGYSAKLAVLTPTWTRYEFDVVTPEVNVGLLFVSTTPGTFWVDDVSITSRPGGTDPVTPPTVPIPRSYFGMHYNRADTPWPVVDGGIGAVRIWDAEGSQWSEIQASPGVYNWSGLDARLATATANGADLVYTLGGRTPRWASAQPDAFSPYGPGQCAEPSSMTRWTTWVRAIATRYKGRITLWEIWNEPDISDFYCGTADQLVELARRAHRVLKQVDPNNRVLSPGFAGALGPGYLDYFLSQGGGNATDIISYHFYVTFPEEAVGRRLANVRATLARHGQQDKPLWNTEQGWLGYLNPVPPGPEVGPALVARMHLLNWVNGIERTYYYTWDNGDNQFPFTTANRTTLTPTGVAYREVVRWMTGSVAETVTTDGAGTTVITLRGPDGRRSRAVWNPSGPTSFTVPPAWAVQRRRDLTGGVTSIAGAATVTVGPLPVLLESDPGGGGGGVEIIVDDAGPGVQDPAGGRTFTGRWCATPGSAAPFGGSALYSCSPRRDTYRFTPALPAAGTYRVFLRWPAQARAGARVPVTVTTSAGPVTVLVDQRGDSGGWRLIGTWSLPAAGAHVELSDLNGRAVADAARFVPVP